MKQQIFALCALATLAAAGVTDLSRRAPICGSKGYDKATEGYVYSNKGTYNGCSTQCLNDAKNCKSFSFGNGECNLYTVAVAGNFDAASDSPYTFYDASCVSSTSSKTSTTTAKTSTTSSMSTTSPTKTSTSTTPSTSKTTTSAATSTSKTTSSTTTSTGKTTTTSTTKPTTTTTSATSTTSSTSSVSTPPCPLPTFVVTNFKYINSTHNCDCAGSGPDVGDGTGCLNEQGTWCDPRTEPNCTHCGIGVCMTGLPPQPVGYGPPDSVAADISYIGSCFSQNPGTTPLREISNGNVVRCSGSSIQWSFDGDSNKASSTAHFNVQNQIFCDNGGYYMAYGSGTTPMSCSHDSEKNATCVLTTSSYGIPATRFDNAYYAS